MVVVACKKWTFRRWPRPRMFVAATLPQERTLYGTEGSRGSPGWAVTGGGARAEWSRQEGLGPTPRQRTRVSTGLQSLLYESHAQQCRVGGPKGWGWASWHRAGHRRAQWKEQRGQPSSRLLKALGTKAEAGRPLGQGHLDVLSWALGHVQSSHRPASRGWWPAGGVLPAPPGARPPGCQGWPRPPTPSSLFPSAETCGVNGSVALPPFRKKETGPQSYACFPRPRGTGQAGSPELPRSLCTRARAEAMRRAGVGRGRRPSGPHRSPCFLSSKQVLPAHGALGWPPTPPY